MEAVLNKLGKQEAFHIGELSEIAAARRAGNALSRRLGFDETRAGQLAIVITEAATNIVKHAREGQILLRCVEVNGQFGVEVIALDSGPGMANVALRMEDGNSTAGSYGVGLGAIGRLAPEFDIYSLEGQGTVLRMTVWNGASGAPLSTWEIGAICLAVAGETACGDALEVGASTDGLMVAVADGLGHGPDAALASEPAVALAGSHSGVTPSELLTLANGLLRGTRGAAMAVAAINTRTNELRFAGVGNIAGCVVGGGPRRHLMSHNGIVGSNMRKVQEFSHPWHPGAMMILHSDGIGTRWDLDAYPGLASRHPSVIAAVLYRDFARQRDDATVLVVRERDVPP